MTPSQEEYRTIPLTQGQVAIVDAADYDWLNQWKWHAKWDRHTKSFYARRTKTIATGKRRDVYMHREILGLTGEDERCGDHRNGDTLDNRRSKLRLATVQQNNQNSRTQQNNSGFRGVDRRHDGKYAAHVRANGKLKHLGYRPTAEAAYRDLYLPAARFLYGEFVRES